MLPKYLTSQSKISRELISFPVWEQWLQMPSWQSDFNPGVLDGKDVCTEIIIL
jgi:hypothetical protein